MKVELNFSEHAGDEAMAIAVWRAMTGMGRGRAQSLFRQCVIAGLRNMRESDLPEDVYALIAQGVKPVKREKKKEKPITGDDILLPGLIEEDHLIAKSKKQKQPTESEEQSREATSLAHDDRNTEGTPSAIPVSAPAPAPVSTPAFAPAPAPAPAPVERNHISQEPDQEKEDDTPSLDQPAVMPQSHEIPALTENVVKPPRGKSPMFKGIMG